MTRNKPITFLAGAAALAATIIVVAACGSGGKTNSTPVATTNPAHPTSALTTWTLPGANAQNARNVGGPINASNVSTLGVAWTLPITVHGAFGAYATTPVVANGVLYTQDLASNVQAINFTSGKVIWTHKYHSPNEGPNGLTFANGNLYGATNRAAFALDAATGRQLWIKTIAVLLYVLGGARPQTPNLERFMAGEALAWSSPPLLAAVRKPHRHRELAQEAA